MTHSPRLLLWLNITLAGLLGACTDAPNPELQQWMAEQKSQMRREVPLVSAPQALAPERNDPVVRPDLFSPAKMGPGLAHEPQASAASKALIAPELARPKEALEAVALDQLRLVGSLVNADQVVALVQHKQMVYQVRIGNHLGLNYGRITRIDEKRINLREIVPTLNGGWVESSVTLLLQEKTP
jgi:type IV pilus assembly protein PilP